MLINLTITPSQKMALVDIVAHYIRTPGRMDSFINCSESPAVETTPEDLLVLLLNPDANPNQDTYIMGFIKHDIHITGGLNEHAIPDKVTGTVGIDVDDPALASQVLKLYQDADQAAYKLLQDAASARDAAKGHNGQSEGSK